jgi:hypothetical protein
MPISGLVRHVQLSNLSSKHRDFEIIDGLPKILPYGVTFEHLKVIARHIEGMMGVFEVSGVPLFSLKQTPSDVEQIGEISGGNYYMSVTDDGKLVERPIIVDPAVVFAEAEAHDFPWGFERMAFDELLAADQVRENRTPSALTPLRRSLKTSESFRFSSIVGFSPNEIALSKLAEQISNPGFLQAKRRENEVIIDQIKNTAFTLSGEPAFDQYVQQTFLDNVMRGGMPVNFSSGEHKSTFYIYARQNGDLERDYHWFVLEPTYLSQGNGHYRSILQNRRMDGWFFPEIQDFNVSTYVKLIQTDGYNPLVVNGFRYTATDFEGLQTWLHKNIPPCGVDQLTALVSDSFTPGEFIGGLEALGKQIERSYEELLAELLSFCHTNEIGDLHEGYWQDHWFYNLDTVDTYRMIYPDRWQQALLERLDYTYFDNPDVVQPRRLKTVLVDGRVRQYDAVVRDEVKQALIVARESDPHKLRTEKGAGDIYKSNLLVKLLCIVANRMASLDRAGIGVEMEAGKPGWLDSLNGLPGIFGSSLNETFELERACKLLLESLSMNSQEPQPVFEELAIFIRGLSEALELRLSSGDALQYWDQSQTLKEVYREATRLGIDGEEIDLTPAEIMGFLKKCLDALRVGFSSGAMRDGSGIPHTYYITDIEDDTQDAGVEGVSINTGRFVHRPMVPFLEGPVHMLRAHPEEAQSIYDAVRTSELFDRQLNMYRCCTWLKDEPFEIGRIKSYARGWIENESIYTHMEYKWLLEVLRSGLHDQFFDDLQQTLIPFLDPAVYGRSIFENCSFIASSVYPDSSSHGRAFQPRLSGVTCEFLNIWTLMVAGEKPFFLDAEGKLALRLQPFLHPRFFTEHAVKHTYWDASGELHDLEVPKDSFAFKLLGQTLVIYSNPGRRPTYGSSGVQPSKYYLTYLDGAEQQVDSGTLSSTLAEDVRQGRVSRIDVLLEQP